MNRKERRANNSVNGGKTNDPYDDLYQEALQYHRAGQFPDAEKRYRNILSLNPKHADSLHMMGMLAFDFQKYDLAEKFYLQAIEHNRKSFSYYISLGNLLKKTGRFDKAIENYKQAIALDPKFPGSYNNIGAIYLSLEDAEKATAYFKKALSLNTTDVDAINNMGLALQMGEHLDEAIAYYRKAIALDPESVESLNNLGASVTLQGKLHEAIDCYRKALVLRPDFFQSIMNYALALKSGGKLDESIPYFKRIVELAPVAENYSYLLMSMIYAASVSPKELANVSREYGIKIANPLLRQRSFARDLNPDRKIRIGYVSPDFNNHVVNFFFEPLLSLHDKDKFEIFAYYNSPKQDSITDRLKKKFDHWSGIDRLNDDEAADLIEKDEIDILIDLAGHTGGNRLMVFARKPAPIQITWLGYPATTGLSAIDYRITDNYAEPVGMTEDLNTEELWRLPEFFCCYQAQNPDLAVIDHPPYEDNGHITFGCFNNFVKVTDPVLETWAKILNQVPNSRLFLEIAKIDNPELRSDTEERMIRLGIPVDRVIFEPRKAENQFVLYNKIDIALDPFPCAGGTTSMDTMWMGVPFITLAGRHFTSRMGVSILTNAALPELIAQDTDEYVKLAVNLAMDKERLRSMRQNLRSKVEASPLMNRKAFVQNMENAYQKMWRTYCAKQSV